MALVIGNDSYQNVQQLKNARADAKAVAMELKAVGFDVTLKQDLSQKMMKSALRDFKAQVQGGDEVVFYFSGHGVQFGGSNCAGSRCRRWRVAGCCRIDSRAHCRRVG